MPESLPYSAAGRHSPWLIAIIVSLATFMEVLDSTIANVSLRNIAGSLAAGQDESTYVLTSYLVSNAIIIPISGWLAQVIGRKRFYMICVGLFTVSSLLCATASSLPEIILWRVMQGLGGGGMAPVEQSIFADSFPGRQRAMAYALYGFTVVLAPALGPIIGGFLTDRLSWHWVFLINLPIGAISLVLVALFVVDSPALKERRRRRLAGGLRIDYVGFILVVTGVGTLQIVLDRFERAGGWGSPFVNLYGSIAVAGLVALVAWELSHPQPLINLRLLGNGAFARCNLLMFALGFVMFSSTQILPQMSQELLGYSSFTAGLSLGLAGFLTLAMIPVSGMVTGRLVQPRYLAAMAFGGVAVAMFVASHLTLRAGFWNISSMRGLQAVWLPFIFIPIMSTSMVGLPADKSEDASALTNFTRNIGASVGVSYTTTLLAYREQFHHARLAEHITPYTGFGPAINLAPIGQLVHTQAAMLAYLDVFTAIMVASALAVPLALCMPRLPKGGRAAAH